MSEINWFGLPPPKPFIKWPGGKRSLLSKILPVIHRRPFGGYWEPFVGGGAVMFAVADNISQGYISDTNEELICTYQAIKDNPDAVCDVLARHQKSHNKEYYYSQRTLSPDDVFERAGRMIYLNKTCFNGMQRVNSKGEFNVPIGSYTDPIILDEEAIRRASVSLTNINISSGSYSEVVSPKDGDLVYCDPPYDGGFVDYAKDGFSQDDQIALITKCKQWMDDGARVVISNSNTPFIRELYGDAGLSIQTIRAPRMVSGGAKGRNHVKEVIAFSTD